jgi:hypothetical protein
MSDEQLGAASESDRFTTLPADQAAADTVVALEDARAQAAYGQQSQVGKIQEIHQELPGRIHVVLIRQRSASDGPARPSPRERARKEVR